MGEAELVRRADRAPELELGRRRRQLLAEVGAPASRSVSRRLAAVGTDHAPGNARERRIATAGGTSGLARGHLPAGQLLEAQGADRVRCRARRRPALRTPALPGVDALAPGAPPRQEGSAAFFPGRSVHEEIVPRRAWAVHGPNGPSSRSGALDVRLGPAWRSILTWAADHASTQSATSAGVGAH
jgi:hypothetical protein